MAEEITNSDNPFIREGKVKVFDWAALTLRRANIAVVLVKSNGEYKQISDEHSSRFDEFWNLGFHSFYELHTGPLEKVATETIDTSEDPFKFIADVRVTARIVNPTTFVKAGFRRSLSAAYYDKWFTRIVREVRQHLPDDRREIQDIIDEESESLVSDPDIINGVRIEGFTVKLRNDDQFMNLNFARRLAHAFERYGVRGVLQLIPLYPDKKSEIEAYAASMRRTDTEDSAHNERELERDRQHAEWAIRNGVQDPDDFRKLSTGIEQARRYRLEDSSRKTAAATSPDDLLDAPRLARRKLLSHRRAAEKEQESEE